MAILLASLINAALKLLPKLSPPMSEDTRER